MSAQRGLDRLVRLFVAPAAQPVALTPPGSPARRGEDLALARRAAGVTVLCRPAEAAALGTVVALALLRACRARVGLVCAWPPEALGRRVGAPARPAARRLHGVLARRGLEAHAAGSLVFVLLADDPHEAALTARRAAAVAPGPVVNVVAGPRPGGLSALLHDADRVLVAGRSADPLSTLALAGLAGEGLDARLLAGPQGSAVRTFAALGLAVPGALRESLHDALEGLV